MFLSSSPPPPRNLQLPRRLGLVGGLFGGGVAFAGPTPRPVVTVVVVVTVVCTSLVLVEVGDKSPVLLRRLGLCRNFSAARTAAAA